MKSFGERLVDRLLALTSAVARRGMMPLRLLSAGAILVCLVGVWSVVHDPIATSRVRTGAAITAGINGDSSQAQTSNEVSGIQPAGPVPTHFVVMSLSHLGKYLTALGRGSCGVLYSSPCPVLARSTDGGVTWQQIHAFPSADSTALGEGVEPVVQPARAISHVLFTSRRVGYVFGSDLWVTRDGGETFAQVAHSGLSVLGLTEWQGKPLILTADGCIQGLCSGRIGISRLNAGGNALTAPLASVSPAAPYAGAILATSGSQLVITALGSAGSGDEPGSWNLVRTGLTRIPPPAGCNGTPFVTVVGRGSRGFLALCDAAVSPSTTTYSPMVSQDGASWTSAGSGNLTLPTQGRVSLATFDGIHIVATSGGPRSAPDGTTRTQRACAIVASVNAGKSWATPTHCGEASPGGMDDVEAWGANEFVTLTGTTSNYWRSSAINRSWIPTKISDRGD